MRRGCVLVWLAVFFFRSVTVCVVIVWSGVGLICGYYKVVVSGCVQSPELYRVGGK